MLTKEECFDALSYLNEHAHKCTNCIHVNIRCDECEQDNTMECDIAHYRLTSVIENYYELLNPQPYKFEDLKKGMWVWDEQLKWCFEIGLCKVEIEGYESLKMFKVKNYDDSLSLMIFEEGRFFPITKAMEYQKKDDEK